MAKETGWPQIKTNEICESVAFFSVAGKNVFKRPS